MEQQEIIIVLEQIQKDLEDIKKMKSNENESVLDDLIKDIFELRKSTNSSLSELPNVLFQHILDAYHVIIDQRDSENLKLLKEQNEFVLKEIAQEIKSIHEININHNRYFYFLPDLRNWLSTIKKGTITIMLMALSAAFIILFIIAEIEKRELIPDAEKYRILKAHNLIYDYPFHFVNNLIRHTDSIYPQMHEELMKRVIIIEDSLQNVEYIQKNYEFFKREKEKIDNSLNQKQKL